MKKHNMELQVPIIFILCAFISSAKAQTCSIFCGPGQICQYVGFKPTCVPYMYQGGWGGSRLGSWGLDKGFFPGNSGWIDPKFGSVGAGIGVAGIGAAGLGIGGVGTGFGGIGAGIGVGGVAGGAGFFKPVGVGLAGPNVGVVNPGGLGPGVVENNAGQLALNLNIQNTNVNQHTHSGSGGVQVNDPLSGVIGQF